MEKNIYFFQESTNSILDLADELTYEELGLYTLLKATYIKYSGLIPIDKLKKYSHYQGSSKKLQKIVEKTFTIEGDLYINKEWNIEIKRIKKISEKAKKAVNARWSKRDVEQAKWASFEKDAGIKSDTDVHTDVHTNAYTKQHTKTHTNCKLGTINREPLNNNPNNEIIKTPLTPHKEEGVLKEIKGGNELISLLDDDSLNKAKKNAPQWDIYNLAEVYAQGIKTRGMPNDIQRAFIGWCGKYTKGLAPS